MARLRLGLPRRTDGDPLVNGFTRTTRGVVSNAGPQLASAGPGPNASSFTPLPGAGPQSGGTVESFVTQLSADIGPEHCLAGVAFAGPPNIILFHGELAVPSSAELWINNVLILASAVTVGPHRMKLAFEQNRVRFWIDGGLAYDNAPAGIPALATAQLFVGTDANANPHAAIGWFNASKVTKGNAFLFRRCPANGSVVVNLAGGAAQTVNLDPLGSGLLDAGGTSFPVSARYRIYDSPDGGGALLADLTTPAAWGGDVIGLLALSTHPADPMTFTIARRTSGLLFRDDFARADGPPGASYVVESGGWAIVANKLVATVDNNISRIMRCIAVPNRKNWHLQADIAKSHLQMTLSLLGRRLATTWYQYDVGANNDGTDPNKTRLYRSTTGVFTRLAGGGVPGIVANVAERVTLSLLGATQRGWIDGGVLSSTTDATAPNQAAGGVAVSSFGNGLAGTATLDNLTICADRVLGAINVPIGYKIRVGALVSAPSVTGDVLLDLAGTALPAAQLEVLDGADVVQRTVIPADGVWGGDLYLCQ